MNPLSILFVGSQMATGGAQRVLLDQARWFHERGHKVTAVFFYDRENLHQRWQAKASFPIINLAAFQKGAGIWINSCLLVGGMFRLWSLMLREKPQVVEAFTHDSNMLVLPLAWMAGVPLRIATHHGMIDGIQRWREKLHAWVINSSLAYRIVAVSELTRKKSLEEGLREDKIVVISNGIQPVSITEYKKSEIRSEIGFNDTDFVLISIGRLVYQKAHEYLISAMPIILKENEHVRVAILGDGELHLDLIKQIDSLGLTDKVKLFGIQDNVAKYLASSDVFVLPSRWEGLPISLLEAMSAGLPVIATRVDGVEEVVEQDKHGLLIQPESVSELAQAILQLSAVPENQRRSMGEAARNLILESYTTDIMCEHYLHIFEQGLSEGKTKKRGSGKGLE